MEPRDTSPQGWPEETPQMTAPTRGDQAPARGRHQGHALLRLGHPPQSEVYPTFGGEMVVEPLIDIGCGCDAVCWNTPVGDAYLAK